MSLGTVMQDELIRDEGLVLHGYPDSLGYLTIGVGRLIDRRKGGGISEAEARILLANDLVRVEDELDHRLPWWRALDPVRRRVLANMAFNLGTDGLLGFRNTLAFAQAGQYERASANMLLSKWAGQVGARAERLAQMMRTGATP